MAAATDIFIQKLPMGTAKAQTHSPKANAVRKSNPRQPGSSFKGHSQE